MKILYINVIEQNASWGAEYFISKCFQKLGHEVSNLDYRKNRKCLAKKLLNIKNFDILFLQRGDRFPLYLLKICNKPKLFWASELVSRNRDQDILLKSNIFNHVFVHTNDCKSRIISNKWMDSSNLSVMLNGFDPDVHYKIEIKKDIDILFVGSMLPRRENILQDLQQEFNITVCQAFGEEMTKLVNRSKIILNIHAEDFLDTETRIYEVLGCGGFVISEKLSSDSPFMSGKHLVEVENIIELKSKLDYYLLHSSERMKIAKCGYIESIKNHSYESRTKELLKVFSNFNKINDKESFNKRKLKFYNKFEMLRNFFKNVG